MKKTTFLLIFVNLYSLQTKTMIQDSPSFYAVIDKNIIPICCAYSSFNDVAKTLSALVQTNNFLERSINDPNKTLHLIKSLSNCFLCSEKFLNKCYVFKCPDMRIAQALSISAAYNRCLMQSFFISNISKLPWNM